MIQHRTIANPSEGIYREKGSKFLAYAFPIKSREDFHQRLRQLQKEHPKARHYCFAYRLGSKGEDFRSSDDGEPSGTAGRPIMGQIDHLEISDVGIVVVRYFGGTLLGAAGLIRAYRQAAKESLVGAEIQEIVLRSDFILTCEYDQTGRVEEALATLEIPVGKRVYESKAQFWIRLISGEETTYIRNILAKALGLADTQIGDNTSYRGISISPTTNQD